MYLRSQLPSMVVAKLRLANSNNFGIPEEISSPQILFEEVLEKSIHLSRELHKTNGTS